MAIEKERRDDLRRWAQELVCDRIQELIDGINDWSIDLPGAKGTETPERKVIVQEFQRILAWVAK